MLMCGIYDGDYLVSTLCRPSGNHFSLSGLHVWLNYQPHPSLRAHAAEERLVLPSDHHPAQDVPPKLSIPEVCRQITILAQPHGPSLWGVR